MENNQSNNQLNSHGVVALIKRNGKFLLPEDARSLMLHRWAPPHGRCKVGDMSEKGAVIREVQEETGLNVRPVRRLWKTVADTKVKTVTFWLVECLKDKIRLNRESSACGWFSVEEVLALQLYPGTKEFFIRVKSGKIII